MAEKLKIYSIIQLLDILPEAERIMVEVLRSIILEHLRDYAKEKISYNVPYYFGKKGIAIIWPSTSPRGGIKKGVLLGFWQGYLLNDEDYFLTHGTNKKIFYKIYHSVDEIEEAPIVKLLTEAVELDKSF